MREITDLMDHYRVIARSIWNLGFWEQQELRSYDSWDRFEQIKKSLFNAIVVAQVSEIDCCGDLASVPEPKYQVIPSEELGTVPIMIHRPREGTRNMYWDDPVNRVTATDAILYFVDYFDWNKMDRIDFQYYRVCIHGFASHPELVGRHALLEHKHARVFGP